MVKWYIGISCDWCASPDIGFPLGRIHVNLNKSGVDLASRVTIFNTFVFVLRPTNQNGISGVTGLYAPHLFLAVKYNKVMCNQTTKISVQITIPPCTLQRNGYIIKMKSHIALTTL